MPTAALLEGRLPCFRPCAKHCAWLLSFVTTQDVATDIILNSQTRKLRLRGYITRFRRKKKPFNVCICNLLGFAKCRGGKQNI